MYNFLHFKYTSTQTHSNDGKLNALVNFTNGLKRGIYFCQVTACLKMKIVHSITFGEWLYVVHKYLELIHCVLWRCSSKCIILNIHALHISLIHVRQTPV